MDLECLTLGATQVKRLQLFERMLPMRDYVESNRAQVTAISIAVTCFAIVCMFCTADCSASKAVVVTKSNETVEKHIYDKDNRPDDKVAAHPSVEANTHWDFEFVPEIGVERTSLKKKANEFESVVRVKQVAIALALPIHMWLPASATAKVIAHENGHIAICKHFYLDAESCARTAAEGIVNREFSGVGATEGESMSNALESASSALTAPFRDSVILPANRASSIYDKLTRHGQADTKVEEAVRAAIAQAK